MKFIQTTLLVLICSIFIIGCSSISEQTTVKNQVTVEETNASVIEEEFSQDDINMQCAAIFEYAGLVAQAEGKREIADKLIIVAIFFFNQLPKNSWHTNNYDAYFSILQYMHEEGMDNALNEELIICTNELQRQTSVN